VAHLARPDGAVLWHESREPRGDGVTFVFFNALTGDSTLWRPEITAALERHGHGWLLFDYRGQTRSPVAAQVAISCRHLVDDARDVIATEKPRRPVYVGLSIGGLFAASVHLAGPKAEGLLLINTLRRDGPRLRWLNDALHRCVHVGGLRLLRDVYLPLLFGEEWLARHRGEFLSPERYAPVSDDASELRLLDAGREAEWEIAWDGIRVPVVLLTGHQDRMFYDAQAVAELAARMPTAQRIEVPDAGHMLPVEKPQAVVDACLALAGRVREPES